MLAASIDACALWRLFMPHLSLPGSGFYCFMQQPSFDIISTYEVAVVQRCCTTEQFRFIETAARFGLKIVYDLDDDVWDLPEYNPAHSILNQYKQGFNTCIRIVDMVTVSTRMLAKVVRKNVKTMVNARTGKEIPIRVCENRMQERLFVSPVAPVSPLLVGWAGSSSHIGDLKLVELAVIACAKERPDVMFEFRGCELPVDSKILELKNYRHRYWMPVAEYGARMPMWGWGLALAPVTEHPFNDSKSCIKMVEAAYCKIPTLASWVRPYDEFCGWDKELIWLLCAGTSSWERKMRELINDDARRIELGERCYKVMKEHYSLDKPHESWQQVIAEVRAL
jgi:hypothetical protein